MLGQRQGSFSSNKPAVFSSIFSVALTELCPQCTCDLHQQIKAHPCKKATLSYWRLNVVTASETAGQHWATIGAMYRLLWAPYHCIPGYAKLKSSKSQSIFCGISNNGQFWARELFYLYTLYLTVEFVYVESVVSSQIIRLFTVSTLDNGTLSGNRHQRNKYERNVSFSRFTLMSFSRVISQVVHPL